MPKADGTLDFGVLGDGRTMHVIVETTREESALKGRAACGAKGVLTIRENGIDERAVVVKSKPVCTSCRQLVDRKVASPDRGVASNGERSHGETDNDEGGTTMTKRTETKIAKLREERTSTNNKISGVKTQLKRIAGKRGTADRRKELDKRLTTLTKRRDEINTELAQLEAPEPEAAPVA
jgi:hypothetical protein